MHCHDWQAALVPAYLKLVLGKDPFYANMKSILTIHNLAFQGVFDRAKFPCLGLDYKYILPYAPFEFHGKLNLMKAGIIYSDVTSTVSPQYAKEIQGKEYGCGLEGVLRNRKGGVVGILNGLNYEVWNPQTDPMLEVNYSPEQLELKAKNKEKLQWTCGFPVQPNIPIFGFVGRLSHQKGLDLILEDLDALMQLDVQLVFLGVGEEKYHKALEKAFRRYPDKIKPYCKFHEGLSHQIFAGSDFFLMPSIYEPCGLSQMISLRYGSIPIVYHTGGLADTIQDVADNGNGLVFHEYTKKEFLNRVEEAVTIFHNKPQFSALVKKAFTYDFSWDESAKKYRDLYRQLTEK